MTHTRIPHTRMLWIAVIGLATAFGLGRIAAADDAKTGTQPQAERTTELDEPPPTDSSPVDSSPGPGLRGPGFGGPGFKGPFGPGAGQGRGPMRGPGANDGPNQGPPQNPPAVSSGGVGPGGMGPGGMGRGGMGLGGGGGPRRFGHPDGPPRWPHDDWDALQKNDPEMYELLMKDHELDNRARQLAVQYRLAPIAGRTAIKKEIGQLVGEHFEVRQQRRVLELKRLEEELERLRSAIELRNEARAELVGERVTQLLGEEEGLDF